MFYDELEKIIPFLSDVFRSLNHYKKYDSNSRLSFNVNDECTLYAVNRINEVLLLSFQEKRRTGSTMSRITLDQYVEFWQRVGLSIVEPIEYHPFLCEIYEVEESLIQNCQPEIIDIKWPCLMFGDLLFSRAGVFTKASSDIIDKKTAEGSTLYWSHWRYNRPATDLSHGWGSNSQWRTRFRLDYWSDELLYYNVNDRRDEFVLDSDVLSEEQRMELLKYRCFVSHPEGGYNKFCVWMNK